MKKEKYRILEVFDRDYKTGLITSKFKIQERKYFYFKIFEYWDELVIYKYFFDDGTPIMGERVSFKTLKEAKKYLENISKELPEDKVISTT